MAIKKSSIEAEFQRLRSLPENVGKRTGELVSLIVLSGMFEQALVNAWVAHRRSEQLRRKTSPVLTH